MIIYEKDAFGINLLFRIHGSAVYRAIIPALCSVGFFAILRFLWEEPAKSEILHPYACGLLIGGITFLIIFRLTQSYGRYWEATSAVYRMQSKFMDSTIQVSNFHMQSHQYDRIKPTKYIDYPELDAEFLTRDRERIRPSRGLAGRISSHRAIAKSINSIGKMRINQRQSAKKKKSGNQDSGKSDGSCISANGTRSEKLKRISTMRFQSANTEVQESSVALEVEESARSTGSVSHPRFLTGDPKMDGGWGPLFDDGKSTYRDPSNPTNVDSKGFASAQGGRTPALFLQELAHLSSLLNAVALSTLRNDVEGVESPLGLYEPGSPWPPVDPGKIMDFHDTKFEGCWEAFLYFMGKGRSPEERTKYNASRPLPVLGGVSDAEIHMLQMARGPLAKTQLCWSWLSEFMNRASIEGSLGPCGQALLSRTNQFLSDGMGSYNDARKIMFIPFPFPHSQHSSLFVNIMIIIIPLMMDQYTGEAWIGASLTFLSVMCLSGIHEVARELENPFRNVPNELPLVTFQAQYNEALIIMYAGFHPDAYWKPPAKRQGSTASVGSGFGGLKYITESDSGGENEGDEIKDEMEPSNDISGNDNPTLELEKLRSIVEQQGTIMEQMLSEQRRLNETIQGMLKVSS